MWDAYRVLRSNLDIRPHAHAGPLTILVTSGGQADGKTMTAINLAITLAASGASVVVVDAELREPGIARAFGLDPASDELANLLYGRLHVSEAVHRPETGSGHLGIIASASEAPSFVDMLVPTSLERLRDQIGTVADILVIDSAPVPQAADALAWAAIADVALIAVRAQHSRLEDVDSAVQCLAGRSVPAIGFVVTTARRARGDLVDPPTFSSTDVGPARRRPRASVIEQS
jgi:non-specific protein-tyrosine kinase